MQQLLRRVPTVNGSSNLRQVVVEFCQALKRINMSSSRNHRFTITQMTTLKIFHLTSWVQLDISQHGIVGYSFGENQREPINSAAIHVGLPDSPKTIASSFMTSKTISVGNWYIGLIHLGDQFCSTTSFLTPIQRGSLGHLIICGMILTTPELNSGAPRQWRW